MTPEKQIQVLAEMDGWKTFQNSHTLQIYCAKSKCTDSCVERPDLFNHPDNTRWQVPNYLISYDAIIPLAQKLGVEIVIQPTTKPSDIARLILEKSGKPK